ncbi:Endonuclease/exonuclease/phosphatase [Parasponia andersonii]|uniref:Endonuclease/exonuclease/phosphatase n=1 Tax=Parasponia andersonii TaxID=3476 RepID=A0A2P5CQN4_PARAD|nr:Endonuclease/exonuclease/phosphatase [Parasponia andersonii]
MPGLPFPMSVLCWNVQGLGNPCTINTLRDWVRKFAPCLLFLSETRLAGGLAERIKTFIGFSNSFIVNYEGRNGGLILLWNDVCMYLFALFRKVILMQLFSRRVI